MSALLEVSTLSKRFGGIQALTDVGLEVGEGTIHSVIGPNGAGKTSLFNCITRVYQPESGTVTCNGTNLLSLKAHRIAAAGLARTFQNLQLFPDMSVRDNVLTGSDFRDDASIVEHLLSIGRSRRNRKTLYEETDALLAALGLADIAESHVSELPYGRQKMVELARALAMRPRLLLLDEPTAGLNSDEIANLGRLLRREHARSGLTLLIIAHDIGFVLELSDWITVLDFGRVIADGRPKEIRESAAVQEAYLGKEIEHA